MAPDTTTTSVIDVSALGILVTTLQRRGFTVIGPTVRDGAIVLAELTSADELPFGTGVRLDGGRYRLRARDDRAAFGHAAGPQSWKTYLHPARERLWSAPRDGSAAPEPSGTPRSMVSTGASTEPETYPASGMSTEQRPRYAFLGVRPCDLRAIGILDRVLAGGAHPDAAYQTRRDGILVIAVECTEPGETCFCTSMGAGPGADDGFDLALTELIDDDGGHHFTVRIGTEADADLLRDLPHECADAATRERSAQAVADAANNMGRTMETAGLRELMVRNRNSTHWDDVASRCLTCGNCTMVCPTCFCTTTEDVTDLTGEHAERWRRWDSCFDLDFSYIHGGSVRTSTASRYRQWATHKLSTWHDQFGSSGCVGCGRCIAWCPVGIDLTAEVAALRAAEEGSP
ncbi:4Fe-4S dicluster domain-containing protein [Phytoactinopolyspora limicola]|uniref:4Fe-4S dicluster domain-containing protein n=1 Tax=Phytoactinopolyspora limicola TaxID=2715536 RepID=UPI001A9C8D24|nr:4Fe-4S dicluster domain-containing protein [Phytoactinopolyspora limicola]